MKTKLFTKTIALSMFFCSAYLMTNAQDPFSIEWEKQFGGSNMERNDYIGRTIAHASGGGYLSTSNTISDDLPGYHGDVDILAVKTDASGNMLWQKCYGGSGDDELFSVISTLDGGFLIMGYTSSEDGDVASFNHGNYDVWVLKIDGSGNIQWEKCFGGSDPEFFVNGLQNADGTYMIMSSTYSNDGDVSGNHGDLDAWLIKVSSTGTLLSQKCFGGSSTEYIDGLAIIKMQSGGYLLNIDTYSQDGDVSGAGFHVGYDEFQDDAWLVKIDNDANIEWSKCYGGAAGEWFRHITQFSNGDIIATGTTYGFEASGDIPGSYGEYDWWVARISSTGDLIWSRIYGGSQQEAIHNIAFELPNGEIILPSGTNSNDGDVSGNTASKALWIVKTDPDGNIVGDNVIGFVGYNQLAGALMNSDGSLIINGMIDETNLEGLYDFVDENADVWMLKLNPVAVANHKAQLYNSKTALSDNNICTDETSVKLNLRITIPSGYVNASGITIKYYKNNNLISQQNAGNSGYTGVNGKTIYYSLTVADNTAMGNGTYKAKVSYSFKKNPNASFDTKNVQTSNVQVDFNNNCGGSKLTDANNTHQNNLFVSIFPNPVSNIANISFTLEQPQEVSIKIFDVNGRVVTSVAENVFDAGQHQIEFNVEKINAGIYCLKMQTEELLHTIKLIVAK